MRVAIAVCKIVEEKSLRELSTPDGDVNFDMLREVRDCGKYVTDPKELMSVLNKLCKNSLTLDLVRATYNEAESLDPDFILTSSEWDWPAH